MNISFRQLRLFLALADTGSVTKAALATHVSQPTASMQLREISDAIGLPVHEVIGKRVFLTQAGERLLLTARVIFNEWNGFEQHVSAMKGLTRGRLRLAVVNTAQYFVPEILGSFCAAHPDVEIALEVLNRDGVVHRLRNNQDDLYIMSQPPADLNLIDQVFMPNPLVLIGSRDHPMRDKKHLSLEALSGQRFILRERGSGTRMAVDDFFRAREFVPTVRLELGSNEAIKEAVSADLGIAIISRHAIRDDSPASGVRLLNARGFPIRSNWHVVHRAEHDLPPIAATFREHLVHVAKTARPAGTVRGAERRPKNVRQLATG